MAIPMITLNTTPAAAAPPTTAAMLVEPEVVELDIDCALVDPAAVVPGVTDDVAVGAVVATEAGTVNVEPPATAIVWTPAGRKSEAGHPCPLQGLLSQQPWKLSLLSAQVYHKPPYGQE